MDSERRRRLFAAAALAAVWLAAYALELLARAMHQMFASFGSDLPSLTLLTFSAVQSYAGWIVVAVATLTIAWLWFTKSAWLGPASGVFLLIVAVGVSTAAFSLALPMVKMCGGIGLPDWNVAQAPKSSGSCGR